MKRVPFNPNALEYTECISPLHYENLSERAIFNTAVAVTHAFMQKGKKLVDSNREAVDYKIAGPTENLNYWRRNKCPRKNADLSDINAKRFSEIRIQFALKNNAETLSLCIRTLRVYTDKHGVEVILKAMNESDTRSFTKATGDLIRVKCYLPQDLIMKLDEEAALIESGSRSALIREILEAYFNNV